MLHATRDCSAIDGHPDHPVIGWKTFENCFSRDERVKRKRTSVAGKPSASRSEV